MARNEASEPELSPAYVAMHEAYRRLTRLEASHRRREATKTALATEFQHLERLWRELEAEEAELAVADSKAGRLTLPWVRQRRQATADRVRADVEAIRADLTERQRVWGELSISLGPEPGYDLAGELRTARAELERAAAEWRGIHGQAGTELARWLDISERATGEIEAQMAEVEEAAGLVLDAHGAFLETAQAVFDRPTLATAIDNMVILGPARHSDHSRWNSITAATGAFRRCLLRLEPELKDLYRPTRRELTPPPSLQRALDAWFDGPFSRWLANDDFNLTPTSAADGRDHFVGLQDELWAFHQVLRYTMAGIEQERTARLLEHPGIV